MKTILLSLDRYIYLDCVVLALGLIEIAFMLVWMAKLIIDERRYRRNMRSNP
jgi:hypothetical protein